MRRNLPGVPCCDTDGRVMETMLEATQRLRAVGFDLDFSATSPGQLRCAACGLDHDPEAMNIDEVVRYEGASDPDDQAILLALDSSCGRRGLYIAAFGPDTAAPDVKALHRLPRWRPETNGASRWQS